MGKISLNGIWNLYYKLEEGNMPSTLEEIKKADGPV